MKEPTAKEIRLMLYRVNYLLDILLRKREIPCGEHECNLEDIEYVNNDVRKLREQMIKTDEHDPKEKAGKSMSEVKSQPTKQEIIDRISRNWDLENNIQLALNEAYLTGCIDGVTDTAKLKEALSFFDINTEEFGRILLEKQGITENN